MAATPKYGQVTFLGQSGMTYMKDIYRSDVAGALINWDSGAGAGTGSETFWTPPENVVIRDLALVTGVVDTTKLQLTRNGVPTGDILQNGPFVDSVATRPSLNVPLGAGVKIAAIQLA